MDTRNKYVIWTLSTFPKTELVWIAPKGSLNTRYLITYVDEQGTFIGQDFISWAELATNFQRVFPDGSLQTCAILNGETPTNALVKTSRSNIVPEHSDLISDEDLPKDPSATDIELPKLKTHEYYSSESPLSTGETKPHQHETALTIRDKNKKDTAKEVIIMEAHARGEPIEFRTLKDRSGNWLPAKNPMWNWETSDYRIAKSITNKVNTYKPWNQATIPKSRMCIRERSKSMKEWFEIKGVYKDSVMIMTRGGNREISYNDLLNNWEWVEYRTGTGHPQRCGDFVA